MPAPRLALLLLALAALSSAQTKSLKLNSAAGLTLENATATPEKFKGKSAIRLTISPEAAARAQAPPPPPPAESKKRGGKKKAAAQKKGPSGPPPRIDVLALADGVEFGNGTIELDLTGEPGPGAEGGARGFAGLAFRVQPDKATYDCFYVRPTNGRADDQERRNHSVQYIQHPNFPWFKLREETPSKYEAYADMQPGEWIHLKIDVDGEKARIYVNKATQPTLLVNDVKSGATGKGGVALWIEGSTIAHFANLKITPR